MARADEGEGRDDDETDETFSKARRKNTGVKQKGTSEVVDPALVQQPLGDMANLMRLRLTKRYIADALELLIHQVEHSMDVLGQLLGSTSQAVQPIVECVGPYVTNLRTQDP